MVADSYYASMAWRMEGRTAVSEDAGRASVPMSPGWALYRRFNAEPPVMVTGLDGKSHWLTANGATILAHCTALMVADQANTTMRDVAASLRLSPSTVSRQLRRLMAFGLLGYLSSRGKYGGITLFIRSKGDGLDSFAREAWSLIRAAAERARDRFTQRLEASGFPFNSNVATCDEQVGKGVQGGYRTRHSLVVRKGATLDFERGEALRARDRDLFNRLGIDAGRPKQRVACPAHGGRDRNLSWAWSRDDRLLLTCWSYHCTYDEIRAAVGL